jgi:hypothetical protein
MCSAAIGVKTEDLLDSQRRLAIFTLSRQASTDFEQATAPPGRSPRFFSTCSAEDSVNQLIAFLLDHAMLDFSGDLSLDMVKDFLRNDDSPEARSLLAKLVQERGVEDMVVTLADCLQENLRSGLNEDAVRDQLRLYSES